MKMLLTVTIALIILLALAVADGIAQVLTSGSTPRSTGEGKPIAQDVVPPIKDGETSAQEEKAIGSQPIEAPAPGVPEDRRTYRELKERAKGGR
jgi:hypothetical protein